MYMYMYRYAHLFIYVYMSNDSGWALETKGCGTCTSLFTCWQVNHQWFMVLENARLPKQDGLLQGC